MKKNLIIIVLSLITAFSMFYAYIKANQATQVGEQVQELTQLMKELKMEAERQAEFALEAATEAKRQERVAMEMKLQLETCQSK